MTLLVYVPSEPRPNHTLHQRLPMPTPARWLREGVCREEGLAFADTSEFKCPIVCFVTSDRSFTTLWFHLLPREVRGLKMCCKQSI